MSWKGVKVGVKEPTCTKDTLFYMEEELFNLEETYRISKMLDAKYQPIFVRSACKQHSLPYLPTGSEVGP